MRYYTELKFKVGKVYEDNWGCTYRFMGKSYLYDFDEVVYNEKRGQFITTHSDVRLTATEARELKAI